MKTVLSLITLSLVSFGTANASSLICLSKSNQLNELTVQLDFQNKTVRAFGDLFYKKALLVDFLDINFEQDANGTIQFEGQSLNQTKNDNSRFAVRGQLSGQNVLTLDLGDYGVSTLTTTILTCTPEQVLTIQN